MYMEALSRQTPNNAVLQHTTESLVYTCNRYIEKEHSEIKTVGIRDFLLETLPVSKYFEPGYLIIIV